MQRTILTVDDRRENLTLLENALMDEYEISSCCSGEECLDHIKQNKPNAILLDVDMPGKDGYETCQEIRSHYERKDLPIIFISALSDTKNRLKGYSSGGDDYIARPFDISELKSKLSVLFQSQDLLSDLETASNSAGEAARTAMTYSAELGSLVQLYQSCFNCHTLEDMGKLVLDWCDSHGYLASIQFRSGTQNYNFSQASSIHPLEKELLSAGVDSERIVRYKNRVLFNAFYTTIFIKNMDQNDEREGRFLDHIAFILSACDLVAETIMRRKEDDDKIRQAIEKTANHASELIGSTAEQFSRLFAELQDRYQDLELGISEKCDLHGIERYQKLEIVDSIRQFSDHASALFRLSNHLTESLTRIPEELNRLVD